MLLFIEAKYFHLLLIASARPHFLSAAVLSLWEDVYLTGLNRNKLPYSLFSVNTLGSHSCDSGDPHSFNVSSLNPHLLHLTLPLLLATECSNVMSLPVSLLVTNVNDLLRTLW